MLKKLLPKLAYLLVMFLLGFAIYYFFLSPHNLLKKEEQQPVLPTAALFNANLPNASAENQPLSQYKGKLIVLNFWATWCPPCREEMPELSKLHEENQNKNLVVLGIAIDSLAQIQAFTKETPVSYPLFAAEDDGMALASGLGNDKGVLPYTLIIDQQGKVVKTYFGRISKPLLETTLKPLLTHSSS